MEEKTQSITTPVDCTITHGGNSTEQDYEIKKLNPHLQLVIAILIQHRGNISNTCNFFKISRKTFYNWKTANPIFAQLVDEIQDARIDNAESVLDDLIEAKEPSAVFFLLKMHRKARERGYAESHITEVRGEIDISHDRAKQIAEAYVKATVIEPKKEDQPMLPLAQDADAKA